MENGAAGIAGLMKFSFVGSQVLLVILAVGVFIWLQKRNSAQSNFRVREADRPKSGTGDSKSDPSAENLAHARYKKPEAPLRLPGISLDAPAHEILGIALNASADQIQKAYRERMKIYHPDKIGRPGSREWQDAQKIAEAINRAKTELLAKAQSQKPNRSGR